MEFIREILAKNLLLPRKERGVTQGQLASALNTTAASYSRWENAAAWPDPESLEKLASFYGIRSSRFFYDQDLEKPPIDPSKTPPSPKELTKKLEELIELINK